MSYDPWEDFLALPKPSRLARLVGPPLMPQPVEASVRDGFLTWTWYSDEVDGSRKSPKLQPAPPRLCLTFARLAQASDEDIRRFAKKWGPLNRHKRQVESLKTWRRYARLAQALMRFVARLISGGRGDQKDWRLICSSTRLKGLESQGLKEREQMAIVAAAVNIWFARARQHGVLAMVGEDLPGQPTCQ